eukprot:839105_1
MAQMNDSFSEEELCLMADEIMKDLMTTCTVDPTDSPILETDSELIIPEFPSLIPTFNKSKSATIPKTKMDLSLTPTIISETHCKLFPFDSIDINSIPPIPYSNSNTQIHYEEEGIEEYVNSNNKWSKYNSKSETLKAQLPYIDPPQMFLSISAHCDPISDIINIKKDITWHISPRPRINTRKRAQSQIPDYSKSKKINKHKHKRKKNKKRRHTLKRVVSPIFIRVNNNSNINSRSNSNHVRKAVQQNMNEENNEYAIEFEE